jgi:hypothetical protein
MNKFAQAAVAAVRLYADSRDLSPRAAWDQATTTLFGPGTASQEKGCPRDAFLGLCEEGLVKGIPGGKYCRSLMNKEYALLAVRLIRDNPTLSQQPAALWQLVLHGTQKAHNGQMDVVVALWHSGLIV